MLSPEMPKLNIEPKASLEEFETIHRLRDELTEKLNKVNAALADIEKAQPTTLSPETQEQLASTKEKLEAAREHLVGQMPEKTPVENLAEKIRHSEDLSKQDLTNRSEHWDILSGRLEKLAQPETSLPENSIEDTGPNLERSRSDYARALFDHKGKEGDAVIQEHLKTLKAKYQNNVTKELEQVKPENELLGKRIAELQARMDFLKEDRELFNNEYFAQENEETKKRIIKVLDKGFDKTVTATGFVLEKTGTAANRLVAGVGNQASKYAGKVGEGVNKTMQWIGKTPKGAGAGWLYYLTIPIASPTIIGTWAGEKIHEKITSSVDLLKKKFQQATSPDQKGVVKKEPIPQEPVQKPLTLTERFSAGAPKDTPKPEVIIDTEQTRTQAFLEKAFGEKLDGENKKAWEKLQNLSTMLFFKPTEWTVASYKPWQKKIYDVLLPLYSKENPPIKGSVSVKDYIINLARQDKLKDVWNQPSSNNS